MLWCNFVHLQRRSQGLVQAGYATLGELHLHPGTRDTKYIFFLTFVFNIFSLWRGPRSIQTGSCLLRDPAAAAPLSASGGMGLRWEIRRHNIIKNQDFFGLLQELEETHLANFLEPSELVTYASTWANWSRNTLIWQNCTDVGDPLQICTRNAFSIYHLVTLCHQPDAIL